MNCFASFSFRLVNTQEHQMNHTNILEELASISARSRNERMSRILLMSEFTSEDSNKCGPVCEPRKRMIRWIKKRLSKQQDLRVSHQEGTMQSIEWRQNVKVAVIKVKGLIANLRLLRKLFVEQLSNDSKFFPRQKPYFILTKGTKIQHKFRLIIIWTLKENEREAVYTAILWLNLMTSHFTKLAWLHKLSISA